MDIARVLINLSCQQVEGKAVIGTVDATRVAPAVLAITESGEGRTCHSAIKHVEFVILATARSASILQ